MIPAGYLLKRTTPPPGWLTPSTSNISEVCSVSNCVNDNVIELIDSWKFNRFGLANSKEVILELAREAAVDFSHTTLFFYAGYERELETDGWEFDPARWRALTSSEVSNVKDKVTVPEESDRPVTLGYDVVAYGDFPDHSPLSCNSMATELSVNEFCLFDHFDTAKGAIDAGKFGGGCEDGIYRIMSVSRLDSWQG
ncbi:hypothetical protein P7228_04595 [Altererythrobacter arenosus]|uniref:Uncharacterized protein n=1 Tax=Altererythrobacter arenosus TaxID=3032592 RepID=A0ABY8FWL3_9SPHN|nr:hypothetical protein [Altererythrobacter sp. CAU 1644]WFL78348.1 hypothetical protein P7228_04595 [Altererythrobacter sp. CAU 1644]